MPGGVKPLVPLLTFDPAEFGPDRLGAVLHFLAEDPDPGIVLWAE